MSHRRRLAPILLLASAGLGPAAWGPVLLAAPPKAAPKAPAPKAVPDPEGVLQKARAAYVNLAGKGFNRYRFVATPDWAAMLADQAKANPEGYKAAMDLFAKVRFDVRVGPQGDAQVSHNTVDSPNPQTTAGLNQVYSGMEQTLTGFFQTWAPFMVNTPFPPAGASARVMDAGSHYLVDWEETGDVKVHLQMDRTFTITEMKVKSPAFDSTIRPTFERQPGGLVLAGYDGDYLSTDSSLRLKVLITNKAIQDLPLPVALDLSVWMGSANKQQILMTFSELNVEKK
ncbi:hypothetical protein [Geothrix alkalitolerans]|uniref:hypothetical protein n=1 Tax=Geothrix alkalitolerans TaxID=2922724 RepID=UPI001FAFCDA6|nr:hypothetical protein [Geothrix alkalitolerans]